MNWNRLNRLLLGGVLCGALLTAGKIHADEEPSQVLTPISNSTLSGIVDTSHWLSIGVRHTTVDEIASERGPMPVPVGISTQPGSFVGTTQPPTAIESVSYFSRQPDIHMSYGFRPSSGGSRAVQPSEPDFLPVDTTDNSGFSFSGAENTIPDLDIEFDDVVVTIPEPSTLALMLGGAGLLAIRMRRKA